MNPLTTPYRVNVRPLHKEMPDSYTTRLLSQNHETEAQRKHLLRLARLDGATGSDKTLWASIVQTKTGRQTNRIERAPDSEADTSILTRLVGTIDAPFRYLCTRCANGSTVYQQLHFERNICLKHHRWVGLGTTPETQVTIGPDAEAAERKFRKLRATNRLTPAMWESLERCLRPLSNQIDAPTRAAKDAAVFPTMIRLATILTSRQFSADFFDQKRSYANAYRYLSERVAVHVPNSREEVTRLLWLSFRSTFLTIRETFDGSEQGMATSNNFSIAPEVEKMLTRLIGPYESFVSYLAPTGDQRLDAHTADRPDSYDKMTNICRVGHRLTKPLYRTNASTLSGTDNCPVCMHRDLCRGVNDMETTYPWLAQQLHPSLNEGLTARDLFANSHKKLVWTCDKDDRHIYAATASNRNAGGSGCAVCLNRVIIIGVNNLRTLLPQIAREWHPTKNGYLSVDAVAPGSNELVWWNCPIGHTYRRTVGNRTRGAGCHHCVKKSNYARTLAIARPDLAAEMHHTKNGALTPDTVKIGSGKDIVWRCPNDHDYVQRPERRNAGYGCPICSGRKLVVGVNDIQARYPAISTEWHSWKNGAIEPCDLVPGNRKFWWKCTAAGHVYEQNVPHRVETGGCPSCNSADRIAYGLSR